MTRAQQQTIKKRETERENKGNGKDDLKKTQTASPPPSFPQQPVCTQTRLQQTVFHIVRYVDVEYGTISPILTGKKHRFEYLGSYVGIVMTNKV